MSKLVLERHDGFKLKFDKLEEVILTMEIHLCDDCHNDLKHDYREMYRDWNKEMEMKFILGTACGSEWVLHDD